MKTAKGHLIMGICQLIAAGFALYSATTRESWLSGALFSVLVIGGLMEFKLYLQSAKTGPEKRGEGDDTILPPPGSGF